MIFEQFGYEMRSFPSIRLEDGAEIRCYISKEILKEEDAIFVVIEEDDVDIPKRPGSAVLIGDVWLEVRWIHKKYVPGFEEKLALQKKRLAS